MIPYHRIVIYSSCKFGKEFIYKYSKLMMNKRLIKKLDVILNNIFILDYE